MTMFTQVGARQKFGEKTWFLDKKPGFRGTGDLLTQKNVISYNIFHLHSNYVN